MIIFENFIILLSIIPLLLLIIILYSQNQVKKIFLYITFSGILFLILFKITTTYHAPFSNLYESLIFFTFIYMIKIIFFYKEKNKLFIFFIIPVIMMLLILILLPNEFKKPQRLAPALQSVWFLIHVPAFFIGYLSLTFCFIYSLTSKINSNHYKLFDYELKSSIFFIAGGIISGAFWAEESCGIFWGWDPKECWALATWMLLILTLHIKSNSLKKNLIITSFIFMLFTYFGVMFLLPGLHSYK